jgi:hypothetical protein
MPTVSPLEEPMTAARSLSFLLIALMILGTLLTACSDDDDDSSGSDQPIDDDNDAADDDSGEPDDDDDDNDDNNDNDDFNLSDPLGEGEVRAGQVSAENELIGGSRAKGEIGDYKIYNSRVEFIVRSPEKPAVGFSTYSGNIIDADRARPPAEAGQDNLQSIEHVVCIVRGFWPQTIEVISDGSDGVGVIRVTGKDGGIPFTDALLSSNIPISNADYQVRIVNDYILEADKDYITIRTTVFNDADYDKRVAIADMPFWGFDTDTFLPRTGFNVGGLDLEAWVRWVGGLNLYDGPISYALATAGASARLFIPYIYGNVIPSAETLLPVAAQGQNSFKRLFIVGDGDSRLIAAAIHEYDGNTDFGVLTGHLTLVDGFDYSRTRLFVLDERPAGENYVAMLVPDADGNYTIELDPGQYTLLAQGDGRADAVPVPFTIVPGEKAAVDAELAAPGYLELLIQDENGDAVPCKITVQNGFSADPNGPVAQRFFSVMGSDLYRLKPGDYTISASRGYEYEILTENVTIESGLENAYFFAGEIEHSVNSDGWITTDFHIHSAYSTDSFTEPVERVRQMAAEGVEMPVITEHDVIVPYDGYVADAGATQWVKPITGVEVSPGIGHFNAWPVEPNPERPEFYGLPFMLYDDEREIIRNYEFPEMWQFARDDYSARFVQINHPRGWYEYAGYTTTDGVDAADPLRFGTDFEAIEVWNGSSSDTIEYWFSFLDQGYNFTMHGNSDSHNYDGVIGDPRNLIAMPLGGDDPADADVEDFFAGDLAHQSQISSGPLIDFSIGDQMIGGLVTGLGGSTVTLSITVQAPLWVQVDYLRVYSNHGELVYEEALAPTGEVVRFDGDIDLEATGDVYYVVKAGHTSAQLGPFNPGNPVFAITNPIWVDIDGNGVFDPPGLPDSLTAK